MALVQLMISEFVIEEIRRSSFYQNPTFRHRLAGLLLTDALIMPYPSWNQVRPAQKVISAKDAPILASAKQAKVSALVSWDKEMISPAVERYLKCPAYLPGDYLKYFRSKTPF